MQVFHLVLDRMKNKIVLLVLISALFSCVVYDDEDISMKDLLIGKWQLTSYTENGVAGTNDCILQRSFEFTEKEFIADDYYEDDNGECINEEKRINYTVNDTTITFNNVDLELNIENLSVDTLDIEVIVDGKKEQETYIKIN